MLSVPKQRALAAQGLGFDGAIPPNGYQWWYVDAFSDDGTAGMTLIVFIGSVFSPYYARARKKSSARAEDFCSINAIFYGPKRKYWAMTERGANDLSRTASRIAMAASSVTLADGVLAFDIDEICVPFPRRLRGSVRVELGPLTQQCFALDPEENHRWWPIAPASRVTVDLEAPELYWQGDGYVDCNAGTVPLESSFTGWHWTRTDRVNGDSWIFYNRTFKEGGQQGLTLRHNDQSGIFVDTALEDGHDLVPTPIWRCARPIIELDSQPTITKTFEDTPFYARSKIAMAYRGEQYAAMHEYVDLNRFERPWVQQLLPFRMPRNAR